MLLNVGGRAQNMQIAMLPGTTMPMPYTLRSRPTGIMVRPISDATYSNDCQEYSMAARECCRFSTRRSIRQLAEVEQVYVPRSATRQNAAKCARRCLAASVAQAALRLLYDRLLHTPIHIHIHCRISRLREQLATKAANEHILAVSAVHNAYK